MISVFALEHAPHEDPVYIRIWLEDEGIQCRSIRLYTGESLPDPSLVDLLIVLGGPMNIYESDLYPWLKEERKFINEIISKNIPILGICLGGQLIADCLGVL